MKIRNGFVSNSSSSSFLVALPKADYEYGAGDMYKILFGVEPKYPRETGKLDAFVYYEDAYDRNVIAAVVAKDLADKKHTGVKYGTKIKLDKEWFDRTVQDLVYFVNYHCFDHGWTVLNPDKVHPMFQPLIENLKVIGKEPEGSGYNPKLSEPERQAQLKKDWAARDKWFKASSKIVARELKKFLKIHSEKYDFYTTEYSDNDGAFYSALEHGGVFEQNPHIRFSHH